MTWKTLIVKYKRDLQYIYELNNGFDIPLKNNFSETQEFLTFPILPEIENFPTHARPCKYVMLPWFSVT